MTIIELPQATIAVCAIEPEGGTRREREQAAVARLMAHAAGRPVPILHRPDGAPYPGDGCPLHISVSHSRHLAALLWSTLPCYGIDIEEPRPGQLERTATRTFTPAELEYLGTRLLQGWTLKEAAYKAAPCPEADLRHIHIAPDMRTITSGSHRLEAIVSRSIEHRGIEAWLSVVYSL